MTEVVGVWGAQPGQQNAAIECPYEDLFYGGERGGGKSDFLLGDWLVHNDTYGEHTSGILFRRTYDELTELVKRSKEIFPKLDAKWTGPGGDPGRCWTMPNGSQLLLRYLDKDDDADHYQGHQYTWLGVDQVEAFQDSTPIDKLWGSLRSAHGIPCVRRLTGNPPAPQWIRSRYIDGRTSMVPFKYLPQPELAPDVWIEAAYIHARLEDNPLLMENDPGYENRLAAVGSEALYRAWRYGDWDAMVGQVFKEWRRDLHVLNEFTRPHHWSLAAGLDWGYRAPFSFTLFASGPEHDCVGLDEIYAKEVHAKEAGHACGLMCQQYGMVEYIAADHDMWRQTGTGAPTIAEEFQQGLWDSYGGHREHAPSLIEATKGPGSRLIKLQLTHRYLAWEADDDGQVQPWNRPLLRFTSKCENAIRTLPVLQYSKIKGRSEDVDTDMEDHTYDSTTIYLMSRPPLPDKLERPQDHDLHPGFSKTGKRRRWQAEEEPEPELMVPEWTMPNEMREVEGWE